MLESFANFLQNTGLYALISSGGIDAVKTIIMIAIACVLLYLAIVKKFEQLLLLPIAFGMLLSNLPMIKDSSAIMMHTEFFTNPEYMTDGKYINVGYICQHGGLLDLLYLGVKLGIYPPPSGVSRRRFRWEAWTRWAYRCSIPSIMWPWAISMVPSM